MPPTPAEIMARRRAEIEAQRLLKIEDRHVWLCAHKRDLHLIEVKRRMFDDDFGFEYVAPLATNMLPVALDEWLRQEMPDTPIGVVKPITRATRYFPDWPVPYVDFSPEGFARYIAEWEGAQQRAQTAGFKRTTIEYEKWRTYFSRYNIGNTPRTDPTEVRWWDTPVGMIWCEKRLIDEVGEEITNVDYCASLWLRAQEQYPQLANIDSNTVVSGIFHRNAVDEDAWFCHATRWPSSSEEEKWNWFTQCLRSKGAILPEDRTVRQQKICTFLCAGQARVKFR